MKNLGLLLIITALILTVSCDLLGGSDEEEKATFTISGSVTGIDSVKVLISGDIDTTISLPSGGNYSVKVTEGGTYTIVPTRTGYAFLPGSKTVMNIAANVSQNFEATKKMVTISGLVQGAAGVTVALSGDKDSTYSVEADSGSFSFTVPHSGSYVLTPSKAGYLFSPDAKEINLIQNDETVVFNASTGSAKLSGSVYGADSVKIILSNASGVVDSVTATSANDYSYEFDVALGGDYTITPQKANFTMKPTRKTFTSIEQSRTQDFTIDMSNKVVFSSNRDGNWEIYLMDSDGANPMALTSNTAVDKQPTWSPDGTKIAFVSDRSGNYEIYVMNADASNVTKVTDTSGNEFNPTWSPDGSLIAFSSVREVYVMNPDGSGVSRVTSNSGREPAWSPDGSKLVFTTWRDGNDDVYEIFATGTFPTAVTDSSSSDYFPSWSPYLEDKTQIAFVSDRAGNDDIFVVDYVVEEGISDAVNLTATAEDEKDPSWSPDGASIIYVQVSTVGAEEIFTMAADGSEQTNITNLPTGDKDPAWCPAH